MSKSDPGKPEPSLGDYLTVGEAAAFLGVSAATLRNWDREGKLIATRHPLNGYRLYEKASLQQLLATVAKPASRQSRRG